MITLVNPETGVEFHYEGRWLRQAPATDTDVRQRRARFRGDKVYLNLPVGVQIQFDKGVLQLKTDFDSRRQLEADSEITEAPMPKGNASFETWVNYAVSQGMSRDEAMGLTRDAIKLRFAEPAFDPDSAPDMSILNETA